MEVFPSSSLCRRIGTFSGRVTRDDSLAIHGESIPKKSLTLEENQFQDVDLSKTYASQHGAMLLFTDRYHAWKLQSTDHSTGDIYEVVKTLKELRQIVLSFGLADYNLMKRIGTLLNDESMIRVRAGFSPNRYLSSIAKLWEPRFLDKFLQNERINKRLIEKYFKLILPDIIINDKILKDSLISKKPCPYSSAELPLINIRTAKSKKEDETNFQKEALVLPRINFKNPLNSLTKESKFCYPNEDTLPNLNTKDHTLEGLAVDGVVNTSYENESSSINNEKNYSYKSLSNFEKHTILVAMASQRVLPHIDSNTAVYGHSMNTVNSILSSRMLYPINKRKERSPELNQPTLSKKLNPEKTIKISRELSKNKTEVNHINDSWCDQVEIKDVVATPRFQYKHSKLLSYCKPQNNLAATEFSALRDKIIARNRNILIKGRTISCNTTSDYYSINAAEILNLTANVSLNQSPVSPYTKFYPSEDEDDYGSYMDSGSSISAALTYINLPDLVQQRTIQVDKIAKQNIELQRKSSINLTLPELVNQTTMKVDKIAKQNTELQRKSYKMAKKHFSEDVMIVEGVNTPFHRSHALETKKNNDLEERYVNTARIISDEDDSARGSLLSTPQMKSEENENTFKVSGSFINDYHEDSRHTNEETGINHNTLNSDVLYDNNKSDEQFEYDESDEHSSTMQENMLNAVVDDVLARPETGLYLHDDLKIVLKKYQEKVIDSRHTTEENGVNNNTLNSDVSYDNNTSDEQFESDEFDARSSTMQENMLNAIVDDVLARPETGLYLYDDLKEKVIVATESTSNSNNILIKELPEENKYHEDESPTNYQTLKDELEDDRDLEISPWEARSDNLLHQSSIDDDQLHDDTAIGNGKIDEGDACTDITTSDTSLKPFDDARINEEDIGSDIPLQQQEKAMTVFRKIDEGDVDTDSVLKSDISLHEKSRSDLTDIEDTLLESSDHVTQQKTARNSKTEKLRNILPPFQAGRVKEERPPIMNYSPVNYKKTKRRRESNVKIIPKSVFNRKKKKVKIPLTTRNSSSTTQENGQIHSPIYEKEEIFTTYHAEVDSWKSRSGRVSIDSIILRCSPELITEGEAKEFKNNIEMNEIFTPYCAVVPSEGSISVQVSIDSSINGVISEGKAEEFKNNLPFQKSHVPVIDRSSLILPALPSPVKNQNIEHRELRAAARREEVERKRKESQMEKLKAFEEKKRMEELQKAFEAEEAQKKEERLAILISQQTRQKSLEQDLIRKKSEALAQKMKVITEKELARKKMNMLLAEKQAEIEFKRSQEQLAAEIQADLLRKEAELFEKLNAKEKQLYEKQRLEEELKRKLEEEENQRKLKIKQLQEEEEWFRVLKELEQYHRELIKKDMFSKSIDYSNELLKLNQQTSRSFTYSWYELLPFILYRTSVVGKEKDDAHDDDVILPNLNDLLDSLTTDNL